MAKGRDGFEGFLHLYVITFITGVWVQKVRESVKMVLLCLKNMSEG